MPQLAPLRAARLRTSARDPNVLARACVGAQALIPTHAHALAFRPTQAHAQARARIRACARARTRKHIHPHARTHKFAYARTHAGAKCAQAHTRMCARASTRVCACAYACALTRTHEQVEKARKEAEMAKMEELEKVLREGGGMGRGGGRTVDGNGGRGVPRRPLWGGTRRLAPCGVGQGASAAGAAAGASATGWCMAVRVLSRLCGGPGWQSGPGVCARRLSPGSSCGRRCGREKRTRALHEARVRRGQLGKQRGGRANGKP